VPVVGADQAEGIDHGGILARAARWASRLQPGPAASSILPL